MKIHRPILTACEAALFAIFVEGRHAEKIVDRDFKIQKKWGARDRRLYAETVYNMVRWWRLLLKLSGDFAQTENLKLTDIQKVVALYFEWLENPQKFSAQIERFSRAEKESIPDWLDEWGARETGENWPSLIHALNEPAKPYLRVNSLKCAAEALQKKLFAEKIETDLVASVPTALVLPERKNVFQTQAYKDGLFEMQDAGSQMIAPFLKVEPGMRVVDACAGAGGKTLHLAALMKNKGKIIALDVHGWKLKELQARARRAGVSLIETREIESQKVIKRLYDTADRLLLDVPCTGIGVLRRHPDTKWKLSADEIERLAVLQSDILEQYAPIVKVGGLMVYATCSVFPSENEKRVHEFSIKSGGAFKIEEELFVSPVATAFDGFYGVRLRRMV